MQVELLVQKIRELGIETITGIPDSTLKCFCEYIASDGETCFKKHVVTENEGASIGVAIGEYLAVGKPACVYMQNSGLGNIVNPITSLANKEVYGIPILLVVGWRGEPGTKDEPQHKYMGKITNNLLDVLSIEYAVLEKATSESELESMLKRAQECFKRNEQFALIVKSGVLEKTGTLVHQNRNLIKREDAIEKIVRKIEPKDIVVSTTGKISRELYELSEKIHGNHNQLFMSVGGMGHVNMIAYQIASRKPDKRIICLDGDGALLMHMGSMAVIGTNPVNNLIHICLNNDAHESVGGMPTGAVGIKYSDIARSCGYSSVYFVCEDSEIDNKIDQIFRGNELTFLEIAVAVGSREDLGRPKETAEDNKQLFMEYIRGS